MADFNVEVFVKSVDLLFARAVEFQLLHDHFFNLNDALQDQPEHVQQAVLDHPSYPVMQAQLAQLEQILKYLKV